MNKRLRRFQQTHPLSAGPLPRDCRRVGVIVPCYRHTPYLQDMLASLERQTYRPFEVVFVDDASPDDTYAILEAWRQRQHPGIQVTLLRQGRNQGQATAINTAIRRSTASLLAILNDDDALLDDALEAGIAILEANPAVYLLGAACLAFSGGSYLASLPQQARLIRSRFPNYQQIPLRIVHPTEAIHFRRPQDFNISHSGMLFFRNAWQAANGYYANKRVRVTLPTDRDFQMRLASLLTVAASETAFAFWRAGSSVDSSRYS